MLRRLRRRLFREIGEEMELGSRIMGRVDDAFTNGRALVDGLLGRVREGGKSLVSTATEGAERFAKSNRKLIGR